MATPWIVGTTQSSGDGQTPFPSGVQVGDLLVVVQRASRRLSDQSGWQGSIGRVDVSGANVSQVLSTGWSWSERKPNMWAPGGYIYRGQAYSQRFFVGVVTDPGGWFRARTPANSTNSAQVVVFRQASGMGATSRDLWRVPATDHQSVGLFASLNEVTVPGGVTGVPGRTRIWTATASGPFAGPGGQADNENVTLGAIEIMGTGEPGPPRLVEPADGSQVANGVPVAFSWAHAAARPGGSQDAYRFRVLHEPADPEDDPVERWWNGTTLVSAETSMESGTSLVELPPSALGVDQVVGWSVSTREALDGEWSPYSPVWSVSTVEPPTAVVTGPTGAVHNTMRPVVEWDGGPAAGEVLVQYHVRVADADGAFVFDSGGQQGSPGVFAVPALGNWVNGAEYVPWVRVRQTGGAWSAWESGAAFTVTWDEPATPLVSAAPGRNGIEITVEDPDLAEARTALLDALAAYTDAPVQWSTSEPGDTSVVWVHPVTGQAREFDPEGHGYAENLVTNGRGRGTSGTVVVVEDYDGEESPDPDLELVDGDLVAPAPGNFFVVGESVLYYSRTRDCLAYHIGERSAGWHYVRVDDHIGDEATTLLVEFYNPHDYDVFNRGTASGGTLPSYVVPPGESEFRHVLESPTQDLTWFPLRRSSDDQEDIPLGTTLYARLLAATGVHTGPYGDGDSPGWVWDGPPHASTSHRPARDPGWYPIEDAGVVAAGEAYADAVGGNELAAEVERQDGDDWVPVALAARGGTATDVLAPYGQRVTYRARTSATIADVTVYSEWAESNPATSADRFAYLADAVDPARWVRLTLATAVAHEHPRHVDTTHGLGDPLAMVNKGPKLGQEGTMTARTATIAEERALEAMLEDTPRLVFRRPAEQRWAGNTPWHDRGVIVLTVNTGVDVDPVTGNYPLTLRRVTFGWVEQ